MPGIASARSRGRLRVGWLFDAAAPAAIDVGEGNPARILMSKLPSWTGQDAHRKPLLQAVKAEHHPLRAAPDKGLLAVGGFWNEVGRRRACRLANIRGRRAMPAGLGRRAV